MHNIRHLTKRSEFLRVQKRGSKAVSKAFVLQGYQRVDGACDTTSWRVGFTASKRVGNAVRRNRAKRRLRALIAQEMPQIARSHTDYVCIARVPATDKSYRLDAKAFQAAIGELHKKIDRRSQNRGSNISEGQHHIAVAKNHQDKTMAVDTIHKSTSPQAPSETSKTGIMSTARKA